MKQSTSPDSRAKAAKPARKRLQPFRRFRIKGEGVWSHQYLHETDNYVLDGYFYNTRSLIITFEYASETAKREDVFRFGWGSKGFRKQRLSHLCIKPKGSDWYLKPDLAEALGNLSDAGLFGQFENVITYGGSMGGFAAMAYADLIGANTVLALNPQTTLNLDKVPWEDRFSQAQEQDWTGPYADAVGMCTNAKQVYCVFDPFTRKDAMHVARLDQPNLVKVHVPFLGHGLALPLVEIKALWRLITGVKTENLDLEAFRKAIRARKDLPRYYEQLCRRPRVSTSEMMSNIVAREKQKRGIE